jgi:hypothetical protein
VSDTLHNGILSDRVVRYNTDYEPTFASSNEKDRQQIALLAAMLELKTDEPMTFADVKYRAVSSDVKQFLEEAVTDTALPVFLQGVTAKSISSLKPLIAHAASAADKFVDFTQFS